MWCSLEARREDIAKLRTLTESDCFAARGDVAKAEALRGCPYCWLLAVGFILLGYRVYAGPGGRRHAYVE